MGPPVRLGAVLPGRAKSGDGRSGPRAPAEGGAGGDSAERQPPRGAPTRPALEFLEGAKRAQPRSRIRSAAGRGRMRGEPPPRTPAAVPREGACAGSPFPAVRTPAVRAASAQARAPLPCRAELGPPRPHPPALPGDGPWTWPAGRGLPGAGLRAAPHCRWVTDFVCYCGKAQAPVPVPKPTV